MTAALAGRPIRRAALIGAGLIGGGWAARLLHAGLDVVASDPRADAETALRGFAERGMAALAELAGPPRQAGRLVFERDLERAVDGADFIQESVPDRLALKQEVLARISRHCPDDALIASSSSGLLPTELQRDCRHPERVLVGHPFNPVYLIPLVELVGGRATAASAIATAAAFYASLGMTPLHVRKEIPGYLSNRLQEAVWRECLHLVAEGVATTAELDQALAAGPGLRWAFWGVNLIFHLGGGPGGMRHTFAHFGPALSEPFSFMDAPPLTPELMEAVIGQTAAQAAGRSVQELERIRDRYLIAVQRAIAPLQAAEREAAGEGP